MDIDLVFREAETLKSLSHKNIVKIFNCFTLKNMEVVFVMEYLEGGELLKYLSPYHALTLLKLKSFKLFSRLFHPLSLTPIPKLLLYRQK